MDKEMEANSTVDKNKEDYEEEEPPVAREKWANKIDFLLACIGTSIHYY